MIQKKIKSGHQMKKTEGKKSGKGIIHKFGSRGAENDLEMAISNNFGNGGDQSNLSEQPGTNAEEKALSWEGAEISP